MSRPTAAQPPTVVEPQQPDEQFWQRYSPNHEFPLSWIASVAIHIGLFVLFLFFIRQLSGPETPPTPPMRAIAIVDEESPKTNGGGKGSGSDASKESSDNEQNEIAMPVPKERLVEVKSKLGEWAPEMKFSPEVADKLAQSPNFDNFSKLGDKLRKDILKGLNDSKADPNSSANRSARWSIFYHAPGAEAMLREEVAMMGTIYFPLGNSGEYLKIADPGKPKEHERVSSIPNALYFMPSLTKGNDRRLSAEMAELCGLDFTPDVFLVFYPKSIEEALAAVEHSYRGWASKNIAETIFKTHLRNGEPTFTVIRQRLYR